LILRERRHAEMEPRPRTTLKISRFFPFKLGDLALQNLNVLAQLAPYGLVGDRRQGGGCVSV
jgi:hypothetical protein